MAKGKLRCSRCDRTFSMAAHLARHMNTMHKRGRGMKTAARLGAPSGGKRRVGRPRLVRSVAGAVSSPGAVQLLKQMEAFHTELSAQRSQIDAQISSIESALNAMGSAPTVRSAPVRVASTGRRRISGGAGGARAGSLKDRIVKVLRQRSKPMTPRDIAGAVKGAGYKTKAKDLTKAVSNALPEMKIVKRVGRGLYSA